MQTQAFSGQRRSYKRLLGSLLLIAICTGVFWQRQNILDWWNLRNYTPSINAAQLATETTMTNYGRRIFYVQKPELQEKAAFYKSCEEGETTIVLGCFKPNNGIYILNVTDDRLHGVEQVTAAHEMLHAAYARLSYRDQQRLSTQLTNAYAAVRDTNIRSKIDLYRTSGADVSNELHSILATEVAILPDELESYYSKYFSERKKIVNFAVAYQSEFTRRKEMVDTLDAKLKELETTIVANNKALDEQQAAIQAEGKRLDSLLNQGQIEAYNSGVAAYNKSLIPFRSAIAQTKQLVEQYKTILSQRNQVAAEAQELEKALDSRIQTTIKNI